MAIRRTTLAAEAADLAALEAEARRRGVSLAQVLRELVAREARDLRQRKRPRFGIGTAATGIAEISTQDEELPARGRLRSS